MLYNTDLSMFEYKYIYDRKYYIIIMCKHNFNVYYNMYNVLMYIMVDYNCLFHFHYQT